jgi:SAM-dependent methyltransferase
VNVSEYEAMYRVEDTLWWYVGMRRIAEALLGERLDEAARILDAGCGTGGNMRWLAGYGTVFGVDLSPHAVAFCARRELTTVARASVLGLPFPDGRFDLVTSFDVVYHMAVADDVAALRELRRVLRPGGWAFLRVPALERLRSEHDAAVHTRQRYSLSELREKVGLAGLEVARSTYVNTLLFPLAATSRLVRRLLPHTGAEQSDVRPAPAPVNAAFGAVMSGEAALLEHVDLPVGLSAVVVARRPEH